MRKATTMTFTKGNIKKLAKFLQKFSSVHIASPPNPSIALLQQIGFPNKSSNGTTILPSELGPISKFNSEGKEKILKNSPKETVYHTRLITDWHGYLQVVNMPYKRYPRQKTPPPLEEISLYDNNGVKRVISFSIPTNDQGRLRHTARLFIELFGQFEVLDTSTKAILPLTNIKRVNWEILPAGNLTWQQISNFIGHLKGSPVRNNTFQEYRYNTLLKTNPYPIYKGIAGFDGYLAFIYKKKNIAILESFFYGNASYVFDGNWMKYSQLTKKEIIEGHLHKKRIIHDSAWKSRILSLIK